MYILIVICCLYYIIYVIWIVIVIIFNLCVFMIVKSYIKIMVLVGIEISVVMFISK